MLTLATAAVAQDAPRPMVSDSCRAEIMKLCPPTGDRAAMRQCIGASLGKFTDGCKLEMVKMRAARDKMRAERNGMHAERNGGGRDNAMSTPPAEKPM